MVGNYTLHGNEFWRGGLDDTELRGRGGASLKCCVLRPFLILNVTMHWERCVLKMCPLNVRFMLLPFQKHSIKVNFLV